MTLRRFLEHLKNQFTHFGYEEKAATQATQGLGWWGLSPAYGSSYWDIPSKPPPDPSLTHSLLNTTPSYFRTRSKLLLSSIDTAHISA